ncbi:hypothetical protein C8J57DRAFT_1225344 [Mycena rebaudengoi]|nr:hypothetical protein C8J57DRAFT_1225344 [Mycena rebaudengoi]
MDGRRTDRSADEDRVTPGLDDPPTRCPDPALALLAADADLQPLTPAPAALYCVTVELGFWLTGQYRPPTPIDSRYQRTVRRLNRRRQGNRRSQGTPRPQAPNVHTTPTPTGNTSTSTSTTRILFSRPGSRLSPVAAFRRVQIYDGEARLGSPRKRSTVGAKHCGTRWAARCAGRMDGRRTDRSAAEDRVTPGLDDPPTRCPDPALALLADDDDQQSSTPAPESPHYIQHQKDCGPRRRPRGWTHYDSRSVKLGLLLVTDMGCVTVELGQPTPTGTPTSTRHPCPQAPSDRPPLLLPLRPVIARVLLAMGGGREAVEE